MRWIGQYIWNLISRFKSDVYLDSVDSGTIASGGNLGVDSNNKIVKANVPSSVTISGTTTDGVATYGGAGQIDIESVTLASGSFNNVSRVQNVLSTLDIVGGGQISLFGSPVAVTSGRLDISGTSSNAGFIQLGEDTDNGAHILKLACPAALAANIAVTLPSATGTLALVDSTARQTVSLRTDDAYIMYLGSVNRWYQANRAFSSIGTQSTLDGASVTDSIAITAASYIAIRPCTIHSVVIAWYQSATADVEFEILKVPLVDNSTSNVTFAKMTHTDHNASYTSNTNYIKTFAITGGNTLTAGQGLALTARRTGGSAAYMNGGQVYAEIEITG